MPTNPITAPRAAEVRQDTESEAYLIREIKKSISANNWRIGELASRWTESWARGRTDGDLGGMVGMSGDQVFQRRRVWDRFGGKTDTYRNLSWSHFYAALNWEDGEACLQWACDNDATVAEMKAWRAAQHPPAHLWDDSDPFGEGAEGAGTDSGSETGKAAGGEEGGQETEGKDTAKAEPEEEEATRPPRNGREASGGKQKSQQELFADQKAKTVKTLEASMRAIDDLSELGNLPEHDAMSKAVGKMIATVKKASK